MKRRWFRALAGLLIVVAVGAGIYLFMTLRPVAVSVVQPEQDVAIRVFGLGTVEARVVSQIGFEVGATLSEMTVDHGDAVGQGDILARLQTREQEARVARAEAGLLAAEVNVGKAEAIVQRANAVLAQRQDVNRRTQALVGRSVVSQETAEEAQLNEDIAAADLAVSLSEVDVAQAQLADARAALDYETTLLNQHVLRAPFDAIIVERHKEPGTVVNPGEVIYTVMAPESVWTLAYVDEGRAGPIAEGQPAEVRLRSQPQQTFRARVARIGIESDRVNEERRVWVTCEQCPPRFFLGEQAEVLITVAQLDSALLVPEAAVTGFDGRTGTAWIVRDGALSRADLTFGHRSEDARIEVVGGLPAGAQVVATIVPGLEEGRSARVVEGAGQ